MKRVMFATVLLLCISARGICADFRNVNWGASPQEVKIVEKVSLVSETSRLLVYRGRLANLNAVFGYHFVNGRLCRGSYMFEEKHTNRNAYISDYERINTLLKKKYGEPIVDYSRWLNDLYRDDSQQWGLAVSIGHLGFITEWATERTHIKHMLNGDNFKVTHGLIYDDKTAKKATEKAKEESDLKGL